MSSEPLDLLGRKLKVGDHVVWQMGTGLGHGFVTAVYSSTPVPPYSGETEWWVKTTKAPGSSKRGTYARAGQFCAIVLPDIQDPEVRLAGPVPEVSALEGSA